MHVTLKWKIYRSSKPPKSYLGARNRIFSSKNTENLGCNRFCKTISYFNNIHKNVRCLLFKNFFLLNKHIRILSSRRFFKKNQKVRTYPDLFFVKLGVEIFLDNICISRNTYIQFTEGKLIIKIVCRCIVCAYHVRLFCISHVRHIYFL